MMRTLARSLALVLAICVPSVFLPSHVASADDTDCSVENSPPTIQQWLGVKEKPKCSLKDLFDTPRPTTSCLEENYFNPAVPPLRYSRCGFNIPPKRIADQIVRICSPENAMGLEVKAKFFGDSLLASCPSLNKELPGLEECAMLTKFEFFKSPELKAEQAKDTSTRAPRFHAEIHSLLQSQALFKLADVFGADSERLLKQVPLQQGCRGALLSNQNANSGSKLSSMTSDQFVSTAGYVELSTMTFEPPYQSRNEFVKVDLMDSKRDELLIIVAKMVVVTDHALSNMLPYPKWSVRANLPPRFVDKEQPSPYTIYRRFVTTRECAAQDVWAFPPLIAMVISESSLDAPELPKPIFEQFDSKTTESLERFEPLTRVLAMNQRGRFAR